MHKVSRRRLAVTTVQLLRERPQDRSHILRMLAAYLIEHKQQKHVDLVLLDVAHELKRADAHLYAEVMSAQPLDVSVRQELVRYLQSATSAKTVELDEQVNPELVAGVVVRTADQELDTSARSKLSSLRSLNMTRDIGE